MSEAGDYLRGAIDMCGFGQAWLARTAGLSPKHVNQLVKGRAMFSADVAVRIERALPTVSAMDLMVMQAREQVRARRLNE